MNRTASVSADTLKMVTLTATSYLEKLRHEKPRQYTSLIETTMFQFRSYEHWHHINVDQTMLQCCMSAWEHSREFVLRFCLLEAFKFFIHIYAFINGSFNKTVIFRGGGCKTRTHAQAYQGIYLPKIQYAKSFLFKLSHANGYL